MPYTIQLLDNMPVPTVLAQLFEPFDQNNETLSSLSAVDDLLSGVAGDQVYLIIDLSQLDVDMGGLMQGFATAFLPNNGVQSDHVFASRVRTLMIGRGSLIQMAVQATAQDQYGNRQIALFETLDAALEHIRQAAKS